MESSRFSLSHPVWVVVAFLVSLLLAMTVISTRALSAGPSSLLDAPGGINGFLYQPNGTVPVGGDWIDIHDVEDQAWMGTDTGPDGSFSIPNLPPGIYILSAHPPEESPFAASLPQDVEVLSGEWTSTTLLLTEVRISGWVQDSRDGARIQGASVVAFDEPLTVERWATTNVTGEYKIGGVQIGVTYDLEVLPPFGTEYVQLPIHYTAVPITTDVVLEMTIPPTNVVGLVHDPTGAPVPGAGVVIFHDQFWTETAAGDDGGFLFRGLPVGEFWMQAAPPWGVQGLLPSPAFTTTIDTPDTLVDVGVITLTQAYKTATGRVHFSETEIGVPSALVEAHRLDAPGFADTPTNEDGGFTLSLAGGEWHLTVRPLNPPTEWIFPGPPAWIVFTEPITATETETATMQVTPPTPGWRVGWSAPMAVRVLATRLPRPSGSSYAGTKSATIRACRSTTASTFPSPTAGMSSLSTSSTRCCRGQRQCPFS